MTLEDLIEVTPHYVQLRIHSDTTSWSTSAGLLKKKSTPTLSTTILKIIPIDPYVLEIAVQEE